MKSTSVIFLLVSAPDMMLQQHCDSRTAARHLDSCIPRHTNILMAQVGRLLEIIGLVIPPALVLLQLQNTITLKQMLLAFGIAVAVFWIGRFIEVQSQKT
jgi:hypothetical protein